MHEFRQILRENQRVIDQTNHLLDHLLELADVELPVVVLKTSMVSSGKIFFRGPRSYISTK